MQLFTHLNRNKKVNNNDKGFPFRNKINLLRSIGTFSITFMFTAMSFAWSTKFLKPEETNYTVISTYDYNKVVKKSEHDVEHLIAQLKPYQNSPYYLNQVVALSAQYFSNRPYCAVGIEGEGDWCPDNISSPSTSHQHRSYSHLQQDPVYRTDAFVCNTFVQIVLALLHANNIEDFNRNILSIKYGAAHEPLSSIHFYNRNNFFSADFNPVNQRNGLIKDVTRQGVFRPYAKETNAIIDRQQWFSRKMQPDTIKNTVRVLSAKNGLPMVRHAQNNYPLPFHRFLPEKVTIAYIPKEILVQRIQPHSGKISYQPSEKLIHQLPTPSLIEIVRDVRQWKIKGKNITEVIGSGINVSHVGLIYRQHFKQGEIIYQKINCKKINQAKVCTVTPIVCHQASGCNEIMFAHATDAYPNSYHYYSDSEGHFHCEAKAPPKSISSTDCNRVMSLPLGDYLMSFQYGKYIFLEEASILGINVEKIMDTKSLFKNTNIARKR